MRTIRWKIIAVLMLLLIAAPSASAASLRVTGDIDYTVSEEDENGQVSTTDLSEDNFRLAFQKYINPFLSYDLYFRASRKSNTSDDPAGLTFTTEEQTLEPGFGLMLRNQMYELSTGYSRQEETDTSTLSEDTTRTSDYFYSRFKMAPEALPSLNAEYNHETDTDGVAINSTEDRYVFSSFYELPSDAIDFRAYINYTHTSQEDPLNVTYKNVDSNFSGNYRLAHSRVFLDDKVRMALTYNGNFTRSTGESFSSITGDVLFQRTGIVGLYAQGPDYTDRDFSPLSSTGSKAEGLTDNILTASTGIGLSDPGGDPVGDEYQNIGIQNPTGSTINKVYIYVNKNIKGDILDSELKWDIYYSPTNLTGTTWSLAGNPANLEVFEEDISNSIYRVEIELPVATSALYLKVVNLDDSNVAGVFVTEIEAYGIEVVPSSGVLETLNTSISQRIDLFSTYKPLSMLMFAINFSVDRSDSNPSSVFAPFQDIITGIFTKSTTDGGAADYHSTTTRNLGVTTTWFAHRLLTADMRIQFNQTYNNDLTIDIGSNTYSLNFVSVPMPHLNANLSITRSEQMNFETLEATSDSVILSIGTELLRNLNMVTDIGYTQSEVLTANGSQSSSQYISGTIDTDITRNISGTFRYNINSRTSDGENTLSKSGWATITYRPGRFVNLSGDIRYASSGEISTLQEIFILDWRPIPVIQLSSNYRHSGSSPDEFTKDSIYGTATWHVKRFLDLQASYFYELIREDFDTTSQSVNMGMSFRF